MSNYVSIGQIAGAVVGAVIGYYVGGFYGAWVGASVGYSLGTIVDPITPDIKTPGVPAQPFQVTPNTVGTVLPDGLGTLKIIGFLLAYGKERTEAIKEKQGGGGKGGEGKKKQTVGYRYYADWVLGICLGPVDTVYTIFKDEKEVWSGEVNRPGAGGQVSISIDDFGPVDFYFGTDDQVANGDVGDLIDNASLNSPLNGLCWAYFKKCYIGEFNRLPTMTFVVRRSPTIALLPDDTVIRGIDYNPMHAIWYILHHMTGLPETWLHTQDFKDVAATLNTYQVEERGIAMLFDQQQPAIAYLENINTHIDGILRYGSDGKFHPKLMRNDYNVATLPIVDESVMLDKPSLSRKSWIDTINELTVQYSYTPRDYYPGTFVPFSMATDGAYLFIVGQAYIAPNRYLRIEKRSMTGQLLDQVDVLSPNLPAGWWAVVVDSTSIYVGGFMGTGTTLCKGIIQKRNKFDLSELRWEYSYEFGGGWNYTVLDLSHDATTGDIFFVGDDTNGITSHVGRLDKDTGLPLWFFSYGNPDRGAGRGIAKGANYVYVCKKNGYVQKLDPTTGLPVGLSVQTGTRCYLKCRNYLDLWLIEHLYLVGYSLPAGLGDVGETAIVTRKHATTLAAQWEMTHGPDVPLEENMYEGITIDDFNVYVVGRAPYYPGATARARMAKYFLDDGAELWTRDNEIATRQATAICHYGTYIYVAGWDSAKPSLYYLERRSKADGRIT